MIYPRLNRVRNGQRMSVELVNGLIKRTEYAADLLRQYKTIAGDDIAIEQQPDGRRISGGISQLGPPRITSPDSITVYSNFAIRYQITATNNPQSFNATNLPVGLFVNSSTGLITGYISSVGQYSVLLEATNEFGTGTKTLTINVIARVNPGGLTLSTSLGGPRSSPLIRLSWSHPGAPPSGTLYDIYRNDQFLVQTSGNLYNDSEIENFIAYRYYLIASTGDVSNEVINGCTTSDYAVSVSNYPWSGNWNLGAGFNEPSATQNRFYGFLEGPYFLKLTTGLGPNPSATADVGNIASLSTTSTVRISPYKSAATFFGTVTVTNTQFPLGLAAVGNHEF